MKIISTKELVYDSRVSKTSIIQIEVIAWNYNVSSNNYVVHVSDSIIKIEPKEDEIVSPSSEDIGKNSGDGSATPGTTEPETTEEQSNVEPEMVELVTRINTKEIAFGKDKIDELFTNLSTPIDLDNSYSDQMDNLIAGALLLITQLDPIYGSEPGDWKIK